MEKSGLFLPRVCDKIARMTADQREGTPFVPSITLDEYELSPSARQEFLGELIGTECEYGKLLDNPRERGDLIKFFRTYDKYGPNSLLGRLLLLISATRKMDEMRHERRNGFSSGEVRAMRKVSERIREVAARIVVETTPPKNFVENFSSVFYAHMGSGSSRRNRENRDRGLDEFMRGVGVFPAARRRIGE